MLYLIEATEGPGWTSPEEGREVLEGGILPLFDHLADLEADGTILAGGLPVGDRAFTLVLEADSNEQADRIVRDIPGWSVLRWSVTPLQRLSTRAAMERNFLASLAVEA